MHTYSLVALWEMYNPAFLNLVSRDKLLLDLVPSFHKTCPFQVIQPCGYAQPSPISVIDPAIQ